MTQAKIEPGETGISLAGKDDKSGRAPGKKRSGKERDLLPELGLENPVKPKTKDNKASPLDDGIDLGK
ncbi:hypothetical protein [Pollutimonas bauzanensis]|uniref:Uncharacterized protein n=1 Tax=Pollutimonas bauzanensis TaxID=658167 RepID=A0A1M5MLS7_9BURK|nr:hypothetical protein [Pollutimonas bauzanensis]SHG78374.1 hypothetical protein SAMN04488135_101261 [Pollutimonas bauzanensis]